MASSKPPTDRGVPLRRLDVAVRTGDTPFADRQKMLRRPPEILITTPESLHLLLTSRARDGLRSVSHVIIDEIHALCPNKRGVFLSLLLERLEDLNPAGFARIGLSATQRPLEEVARYLGGSRSIRDPSGLDPIRAPTGDDRRRRTAESASISKSPPPSIARGPPAKGTVWPAIERRLVELIRAHRSTIVFANNRRVVERLTTHLNEISSAADRRRSPIPRGPNSQNRIMGASTRLFAERPRMP